MSIFSCLFKTFPQLRSPFSTKYRSIARLTDISNQCSFVPASRRKVRLFPDKHKAAAPVLCSGLVNNLRLACSAARSKRFFMGSSMEIQLRRDIQLVGDIFPVLFALTHALGKQIFDLPVHRAEVILCPSGKGIVEFSIQAQGHLFFRLCHISTGCRCSRWAGHPGCRTAPPADWTPLPPCAHRPAPRPCSRSDDPAPFPPCPQRRPRSSCGHQ
mgnify:FL=1